MGLNRKHAPEFRAEIARRMVAGECVIGLSKEYKLARSMMYRWRDAYRKDGAVGVIRGGGRPSRVAQQKPAAAISTEEKLQQRIAELERKVGQQACEIDFFERVFKRLEELPKAKRLGGEAFMRKSDA